MDTRRILRIEGLAVLAVSLVAYFELGGPVWLLVVLALAPDLSMVGYLRGPTVGAAVYNAVHAYVGPLVLGAAGWWLGAPLAAQVAAVWIAHIGADRAFGYGLKRSTGFRDTHLGGAPAAPDALLEE